MDAISNYFDSRARGSEGSGGGGVGLAFTRLLRQTLFFSTGTSANFSLR